MKKNYIVLDIDGVLADFIHSWSRLAGTVYRSPAISVYEQKTFSLCDTALLSEKEALLVWDKVEASPDFWFNIPSLLSENDKRALHIVHDAGVEIIYLTNRHEIFNVRDQTERWIKRQGLPTGRLEFTKDKDLFLRERLLEAGKPVLRLDGQLHTDPGTLVGVIEDNPKNLESYARGIASWYARDVVYVFDRTYNEQAAPTLPRVSSIIAFCYRVLHYIERRQDA